MNPRSEKIIAEWADDNRRTWVRRRDWHGGYRLATLCVVLLFAGLAALLLSSVLLAALCWLGSAASFVTMMRRSRDRRYFITRQSDLQGYRNPARTPWWRR